MKTIIVRRFKHIKGREYIGTFFVIDEMGELLADLKTMELSWKENQTSISCIPAGIYEIRLEYSARFDMHLWEIKGVPYRSECKIHAANYARQLEGCISLGTYHADIDADGLIDVAHSRAAIRAFHEAMGEDTNAIIEIIQGYGTC